MIATVSCDKPCLFSMGTVYFDETLFCLLKEDIRIYDGTERQIRSSYADTG